MKKAIVDIGGHQHEIHEGEELLVDRINAKKGDIIDIEKTLLVFDEKTASIGTPTVDGVNVKAQIVENLRGKKIDIRRYKAKSRYRRHKGFRSELTKIKITKITERK